MPELTSLVWLWCAVLVIPHQASAQGHRSKVTESHDDGGKLLLILIDGFRWDYLDKFNDSLPNLHLLAKAGARTGSLRPDFPSVSIPNHYTLMTGVHTEHHGMTGNFMYDPNTKTKFQLLTTPSGKAEHWWEGGTPLWVTAVNQGKRVSMYRWRGCEVEIGGVCPTHCTPFTTNVSQQDFDQAIAETFANFRDNKTDISGVYSDMVDVTGHWYGPDSPQVAASLRTLDESLGRMMEGWMELLKQGVQVNVMLFSDHGMAFVSVNKTIDVTSALTPDLYDAIMESGPLMSVYTNSEGNAKKTLQRLAKFPHMACYPRDQLPKHWHYAEGKYVAPVTCVAEPGWFILHPEQREMWQRADGKILEGEHGYDPDFADMWGVFFGLGPAFSPGSQVPQLSNVDLYPVMCRLSGVQPTQYDGRGSKLNPLLQPGWKINKAWSHGPWWCFLLLNFMFASLVLV